MNFLAAALPGVRDVRTPLAAGILWLAALAAAFDASPAGDDLPSPFGDLSERLDGGAGVAAVAFAGYVIGLLSEPVWRPLLLGSWLDGADLKVRHWARRDSPLAAPMALDERMNREDPDQILFRATEAFYYFRLSALNNESGRRIKNVVGLLAVPLELDAPARPADAIRELARRASTERRAIRRRLIGKNLELFNEADRLAAEADFRAAIALPIGALGISLGVRSGFEWFLLLAVSVALVILARRARGESDRLVDIAILDRQVTPPTFDEAEAYVERALRAGEAELFARTES
jgi:hypothetical protein